jgi:predicted helicase
MGKVFYADLWGLQDGKYRYLWENDVSTTEWQELEPVAPHFFFVPKEFDLLSEYQRGVSVTQAFKLYQRGVATRRDHFMVDFGKGELESRFSVFASDVPDDDISEQFGVKTTKYWSLSEARTIVRQKESILGEIHEYAYRPFDNRYVVYIPELIERGDAAYRVMKHMLRPNKALLCFRRIRDEIFDQVFVARGLVDKTILSPRDNITVFPLYVYTVPEEKPKKGSGSVIALTLFEPKAGYETRDPNLSPKFIAAVEEKLGLRFVREGKGDLETTFGPEDILHYAYAVFHLPTYRERYAEFLKIDFPRLPLTSDRELFKALAEKGEELVSLHLMDLPGLNSLITNFPVAGSDRVEKVRYVEKVTEEKKVPTDSSPTSVKVSNRRLPLVFEHQTPVKIKPKPKPRPTGRVYINKTQYFEGIAPEVWEFQIGGYQVLHKWLKDRKGRKLKFDDLFHYQKVVVALKETMRLMEEIDELIPSWPIE